MWSVDYTKKSKEDIKKLDNSQRSQVIKAINKVAINPLSNSEGGYGKPLGNKSNNNLTGCLKIKLLKLGVRVVYRLIREEDVMKVIVVSVRSDNEVYEIAVDRIDD